MEVDEYVSDDDESDVDVADGDEELPDSDYNPVDFAHYVKVPTNTPNWYAWVLFI